MLKSIFYARFHSERGPVVLRQHPQHAIFTSQRNAALSDTGLIQFGDISSYIIPPYELCNSALSVAINGYCILGWPVSIEDQKYPRNRFTFNVCFVLNDPLPDGARRAWDILVRKTARWITSIEEEDGMLASMNEDNDLGRSPGPDVRIDVVSMVLEQVFQQLSDYGECCVPVSDIHVLNLRLDSHTTAPHVSARPWDVPLFIARLPDQESTAWNLVLQQIHSHVNGVNHIQRIAELADVEIDLVQSTIGALVGIDAVLLLDIFHFQASYMPTSEISWFVRDEDMLSECQRYIQTSQDDALVLSTDQLVDLYLSLRPGLTVTDFCLSHTEILRSIDVRRLITFGMIKGFLRRMHKYAQLAESAVTVDPPSRPVTSVRDPRDDAVMEMEQAWKQAALSSGWATPPTDISASLKTRLRKTADEIKLEEDERLRKFFDGRHCFDEICVALGMSEKALLERLKGGQFGEITILTR